MKDKVSFIHNNNNIGESNKLTTYKFKRVGFPCRVQPPHRGHLKTAIEGLTQGEELLIMIGSARTARSIINPFAYEIRVRMFQILLLEAVENGQLTTEDLARVTFQPIRDDLYNMERWRGRVFELMYDELPHDIDDSELAMLSSDKDGDHKLREDWFPMWETVAVASHDKISATDVRELLFSEPRFDSNETNWHCHQNDVDNHHRMRQRMLSGGRNSPITPAIGKFLRDWIKSDDYAILADEYNTVDEKYWERERIIKRAMDEAELPYYKSSFNTCDAVVICSGHVLLVERGEAPGKGLLAIPGGYLNSTDTFSRDGALRELFEETKMDIPYPILNSSIFDTKAFDHKERDVRGRVITQAFGIHLPRQKTAAKDGHVVRQHRGLPKVKGSDDAADAIWVPLSKFRDTNSSIEPQMFGDHFHIINYMVGRLDNAQYK